MLGLVVGLTAACGGGDDSASEATTSTEVARADETSSTTTTIEELSGCPALLAQLEPGTPDAEVAKIVCASRQPIERYMEPLGFPEPTAATISATLEQLCRPGLEPLDKDRTELGYAAPIRATAQEDPDQGHRWVEEGILDEFDYRDTGGGRFYVNVEFNEDLIHALAKADMDLVDAAITNHDAWCE